MPTIQGHDMKSVKKRKQDVSVLACFRFRYACLMHTHWERSFEMRQGGRVGGKGRHHAVCLACTRGH